MEDAVQLVVIAREARALLPRVHLFAHSEVLQRDRALCPVHQRVGVTEPIRVEDLESVVLSARDIAGSGVLPERTGWAPNWFFDIPEIDNRARRGAELELDKTGDDNAHVQNQPCDTVGPHVHCYRQSLGNR